MMTAASLAALPTVAAPRASPQRGATGFSFDEAVAATRRNAARALDIHGGAPTDAVTRPATQAETPAKTPDAAAPDATAEASPQHARAAPHAAEAAETAPPAARAPSPVIAVNGQAAAISVAAPGAAAAPQTQTLASAAIRDAAARTRTEAPRAAPPVRAPAQAVTQFAEILAQRLDGASQFDLRLDPPALGGIDGRLTLSDDGEALLSLAFDNQSAFDLFRRDEAALRSALASAGFDLSRHNLQMSFRAPAPADAEALTEPAVQRSAFSPAPLHRGAVDIRA